MANLIFANRQPATTYTLTFDRTTFDRLRGRHTLFDASSPDLADFAGRGGKLILFHGWADPHISPINTIAYHEALRRQMGLRQAEAFERLYLMPGMGHCSGGEGPSKFDLLTPMIVWVERHQAPDAIMTHTPPAGEHSPFGMPDGDRRGPPGGISKSAAPMGGPGSGAGARPMGPPPGMPAMATEPARSRPVYPYPYVAAYAGTGDTNVDADWQRGKATYAAVPNWAGSDYYTPYVGVTA